MPYIKYYGGNPPSTIAEHIQFEDPEEPCFRGRRETRVTVNRRCEDDGVPRDKWDEYYYTHIVESPYEGMKYVGGVGVVKDEELRPFDTAISSKEYEELKTNILAANEAYRKRLAESLAAQNDPVRRAHPEHESLGWRTRVWLASYTELTHHVPYQVDDSCLAYARVRQYTPNGMTIQLVDLYHKSDGEISQAIFDGLERAERFADLLALAGFGAAGVFQIVGTSPPFCREGVSFNVATLQGHIANSHVAVAPEDLEHAHVDETDHLALRHLREGLSATLPTAALASFWNSLERMADDEARKLGLKRLVRCPKCGDERHAGWDIKKGFEAMYASAGVDADFDRHRSLRGRVQHGDTIFSTSSPAEFLPEVSRLQSTAIAAVGKRVGLLPQAGVYLRTSTPVTVFDCVIQGESCTVNVLSFKVGAVPSLLPMRASSNRERSFQAGPDLPPKIDSLVLPPVERTSSEPVAAD